MAGGGGTGVKEGHGVGVLVDNFGGYSSLDYRTDEADHGLN